MSSVTRSLLRLFLPLALLGPVLLAAQPTPSGLVATPQPGNVLRYDVQFTTAQSAHGFVEYVWWNGVDSLHYMTGSSDSSVSHQIVVMGLVPQKTYRYRAWAWDATGIYPGAWDTFTVAAVSGSATVGHVLSVTGTAGYPPGYLLSNTSLGDPDRYLQIHDREGHLIWYERMPGIAAAAFDGPCQHFSYQASTHSIFVSECDRVSEIAFDGTVLRTVNLGAIVPGWMAHHDIVRIPNGNWLVLASQVNTIDKSSVGGDPQAQVVGPGILEIDGSGNLVWSWSAFDHLNPLNSPGPGGDWVPKLGPQAINWLDANSLMEDGDGNPMLSFGGASQVIKLVRNGGNIVWTVGVGGDIEVLPPDSFMHQHALRVTQAGHYLNLDNQGLGTQSRLLDWKIDFSNINPRMQVHRQFVFPTADYCPEDGNIDPTPSGGYIFGSAGGRSITEITSAGSVLWQAHLDSSFYRAYWVDDFYKRLHPRYTGDLVLCLTDSVVQLQASLPGGIWSGPYVHGDSFDVTAAGIGLHVVTYRLGPESFTVELLVDPTVNCGVGRADAQDVKLDFVAFPNPVGEALNLDWSLERADRLSLEVVALDGRIVLRQDLGWLAAGQHALRLTRESLGASGALAVCLRTASGKVGRRIVVVE